MLGRRNRRVIPCFAILVGLTLLASGLMGAGPRQEGVPPAPYGATFFSGTAMVQGTPVTGSVRLVGCIDGCDEVYQSEPVSIERADADEREAANKPKDANRWRVCIGNEARLVDPPRARTAVRPATILGADTSSVLASLGVKA